MLMLSEYEEPPVRLPGARRLGLASVFFTIAGTAGVVGVLGTVGAIVFTAAGSGFPGARTILQLLAVSSMTVGCFRTGRLLGLRRKEGVATALVLTAVPVISLVTRDGAAGWGSVAFSAAGIAVLASVWRHLDR